MLRCLGKRSKQVKEQEDEAKKPFEGRKESETEATSPTTAATSPSAAESTGTKLSPKSEDVAKTSLTPVKTDPPTDGRHSFLRAARSGNLQKVTEHLNSGIGIKTCDGNGLNALHLASKEGHLNVVQELLNRGTEVDARTKKGNTALHISCLAGRLEVAAKLIESGATVNAQSQNGFTPLYMAAQENHLEVVKHLLTKDANQTLATDDGFTPLAVALQQGHEQIVAVLLENDSRSKVRLPALHIAAKKDNIKAASLLLQQNDVNVDQQSASGFTPLHIAAHYGSANVASLLLEHKADVNYQAKNNITPLHVASKWGKTGVVKLLLDAKALPDCKTRDGLTPLHCATRSGHDRVCEELLRANANFSAKTRSGLSPLHMAAQGDHMETTRVLLSSGANVDETTVDYLTPLHVAAHCGNVRVAKLFLDWNCQVNSRALNGFTPLHIACKKNWTKVIELLLKHSALVEATTESGLTPLHVASFMGHMNIVVLLLQHGANVNSTTMRGETPLHLATRSGQLEIVRILLRNKPIVDAKARENQTPLHIASRLGNVDLAGVLLQHGANPENVTKDNYNCMHIAAKEGHEEIIAQLLEHGAPVETITKKGFTPLHIAAKYGRMSVCRLLLDKGAQPNAQGQNGLTALHLACHYNNSQIALLLLENQGNPHVAAKNGYTPLHIAAKKNEMDIAINLLEYGAESNTESRNGFTPLHLASQEGHTDMISLLLQNQANSNFKAKNGLTALHLAAQEDCVPVAEILVAHDSEIAPPTKAGYTPLHTACHFGQTNMIRYLLNQQAPVDIQTVAGYTPLHLAAQQGHLQVVRLLVDVGADPNITNENGWTPAHIARRQHYLNIFEVLRKVTTVVESWEEIEEEIMTTVVQPAQPDTLHEHAFSESEDEGGTPKIRKRSSPGRPGYQANSLQRDQILKPSHESFRMSASNEYLIREMEYRLPGPKLDSISRMDSRLSSGHASGTSLNSSLNSQETGEIQTVNIHEIEDDEEVTEKREKLGNKEVDDNRQEIEEELLVSDVNELVESGNPKSYTGEDSIHENLVALDNRDLNFAFRTSEIEDDVQRSSTLFSELPPRPELDFTPDNVPIQRKPVTSGFLVSFLVDARGGSLSCSRHSGLRIIVPPGAASGPVRVICRMLRQDKMPRPPPLNDGEGLACRVLEMGPNHIKFNGPILLEVPHYAAVRGREREVFVYRSDNGDIWKEHNVLCNDQVISDTFGQGFETLETCDELAEKRVLRILTSEFPQYFALISRVRQDSALVGPDGGVLSSTVVPQVQAVFPENALKKRTQVGLQAQVISSDIVSKLLGNRVAVSPIVTIEPRRRQFHKSITLTIPSPQAVFKGMINPPADGKEFNLRLLCSITGSTSPATWEDITGSMPLSVVKDCVSFTTKLSARFWLIHCQNVQEVTEMGGLLYREACLVPYVGKFVVFSRRHDPEEAQLRAFCITDDKVDKTLECHEGFELKAASPEVEVLHDRPVWLETAGNLIPVTKTGQQLQLPFTAFAENRLSFLVRVKDPHQDPVGKIAFMKDSRGVTTGSGGTAGGDLGTQKPLCTLEVRLPDQICKSGRSELRSASDQSRMISSSDLESWKIMVIETETIAKTELDLREIAEALGCDWSLLARELDVPQSDITQLKLDYRTDLERAFAMLILWRKKQGDKATGNALERGLRRIGREDVVKTCMRSIEYVTAEDERAEATARMSIPSVTSDTQEDQTQVNGSAEPRASTPIELETLVAEIDSRRNAIRAPHPDELHETSKAKTEAYLNLIDQLEATLPTEEEILAKAGLDDTDYQNGGAVEEESVAVQQRESAPASDLSPLLEKISTKPAFAMAPEGEKEEEEEEENGIIQPTKMKVDPVAEVSFDPNRLEKSEPKFDFDSGVEEESLSAARDRGVHSAAPPQSNADEGRHTPDEKSLAPTDGKDVHYVAALTTTEQKDSVSSDSSDDHDFVDAEEKRGTSQEPEMISEKGLTRVSTEESDRFGVETSDLELSMYGPSDATSSVTMTISGISRITPPRSSGVQSDEPDDTEYEHKISSRISASSTSSVADLERAKTPTGEIEKRKTDPSSEDEDMAFQRAYEAAVEYGSSSDETETDHKHHDVKETHQRIYGKPEERSQVEEIEEELEDGTIIKRRIVKKQVIQKVTDRIILEGCPEALAAQAAMDEAAFVAEPERFIEGTPKTTVEEFEEVLADGSVVKRRVEHTTVAEELTEGGEIPEGMSFSDHHHHPVTVPEVVQEVRKELPDGSVVIQRIVRQTHCHEHDTGAEMIETTTLDEGPYEEHEQ